MEHSFAHSVWANDHIWRNRAAACGAKSCSADGGAVGHNKISVIIPCHRVVDANGSLTGYAGGIETKRRLPAPKHAEMQK